MSQTSQVAGPSHQRLRSALFEHEGHVFRVASNVIVRADGAGHLLPVLAGKGPEEWVLPLEQPAAPPAVSQGRQAMEQGLGRAGDAIAPVAAGQNVKSRRTSRPFVFRDREEVI